MLTLFLISHFLLLRFLSRSFQIFSVHFFFKLIKGFHFLNLKFIWVRTYIIFSDTIKTLIKIFLSSSLFICLVILIIINLFLFLISKIFIFWSHLPIILLEIMKIEIIIFFTFFKLNPAWWIFRFWIHAFLSILNVFKIFKVFFCNFFIFN